MAKQKKSLKPAKAAAERGGSQMSEGGQKPPTPGQPTRQHYNLATEGLDHVGRR